MQNHKVLYQVHVFWADRKKKMAPLSLISRDIFDFSTETVKQNSMKLDRKQDLNVVYQVCVFWVNQKKRWLLWLLICWDIFDFSIETAEGVFAIRRIEDFTATTFQSYMYCTHQNLKMVQDNGFLALQTYGIHSSMKQFPWCMSHQLFWISPCCVLK